MRNKTWQEKLIQARQVLQSPNVSPDQQMILEGTIAECEWYIEQENIKQRSKEQS